MKTQAIKTEVERLMDVVEYGITHGLAAGVKPKEAFDLCRDKIVKRLGLTEIQAANIMRLCIGKIIKKRNGEEIYTQQELEIIIDIITDTIDFTQFCDCQTQGESK